MELLGCWVAIQDHTVSVESPRPWNQREKVSLDEGIPRALSNEAVLFCFQILNNENLSTELRSVWKAQCMQRS